MLKIATLTVTTLLALGGLSVEAKPVAKDSSLERRLAIIEDRIEIKELVDTFSNLADRKETDKQALLFTEDAIIETYVAGKVVSSLKGRKQISETFAGFLKSFETVYHANGQLTLDLTGDTATGISYCQVALVSNEDGKRTNNINLVRYEDGYVRVNGKWLIANRKATFAVQDKQELKQ